MSAALPPRTPRTGAGEPEGGHVMTSHGSLAMQLRDIERQAGVRRTL